MYKLSHYAKKYNVCYRTAWNWFKAGKIPGAYQDNKGRVYIEPEKIITKNVVIYARVSNSDRKESLENQVLRLQNFAINNGYTIKYIYKEIASGLNDNRTKLNSLFKNNDWDTIIVENKDRLTCFGFNYIKMLLEQQGKNIIVVNNTEDDKTDLINDLVSIIYSFSARIYGLRKKKNKEEVIKFLTK